MSIELAAVVIVWVAAIPAAVVFLASRSAEARLHYRMSSLPTTRLAHSGANYGSLCERRRHGGSHGAGPRRARALR